VASRSLLTLRTTHALTTSSGVIFLDIIPPIFIQVLLVRDSLAFENRCSFFHHGNEGLYNLQSGPSTVLKARSNSSRALEQGRMAQTEDCREAVIAMMEKRAPVFQASESAPVYLNKIGGINV